MKKFSLIFTFLLSFTVNAQQSLSLEECYSMADTNLGTKYHAFNPIRYFVEIIRMVMLKGSGFQDVLPQLSIITLYAFILNGLAVWSYKKTS